jgi:hypothetical protein
MKSLTLSHQPGNDFEGCVVLHEIAHAVQDQVFDHNDMPIKTAYRQALDRHLLDKKSYAATDDWEFFAEMTCAYFDQLEYYPRTYADLKKLDPVTFKLMESTWGKRKPGTVAKGPRVGPPSTLRLEQFKLGEQIAGPKVAMADLKDRAVLLVLWNARSASSVILRQAGEWDAELRYFGLATVAVHMTGKTRPDIVSATRGVYLPVTNVRWDSSEYVKDGREFPVALVYGHDGRCTYHGSAFHAEDAVRGAVGDALVAKLGEGNPSPGLAPLLNDLRKGKPPASLLGRLAFLTQSSDASTATKAKALVEVINEGGKKAIEKAEGLAKQDSLGAYLEVEHVPAAYKQSQVATQAAKLITRLKENRAVAQELRARKDLTKVQELETKLADGQDNSVPSPGELRLYDRRLLREMEERVSVMKKSWPDTRATQEAIFIAGKYGVDIRSR